MGMSNVNGIQLKDHIAGDDFSPKVRKPYTISKQRERWTEEEHKKFLEALKLHGRAWRKIEEHVGTKTAVQIRSHAQKYFSKVVRESNTSDSTSEKPIEIPPPRPKRKPMHPYPRKMVSPVKDGILVADKLARSASLNLSISEQENQSPTSVLSAVGSDASAGDESHVHNGSASPVSSAPSVDAGPEFENSSQDEQLLLSLELLCHKDSLIKEDSKESGVSSLKLFGKTFVVECPQGVCKPESLDTSEENCYFPRRVVPIRIPTPLNCAELSENFPSTLPWLTLCGGASLSTLEVHSPAVVRAQPLGVKYEMPENNEQKEGSSTSSNLDYSKEKADISFSSYKLGKRISACSKDRRRGFVPYKRCLVERDSNMSSTETAEARENQRIRVCS